MIKIYTEEEIQQGTDEWHEIRSNHITGTDAYNLLNGIPIQTILDRKKQENSFQGNYFTRRGHILEDEAKEIYSEAYEKITNAGFITNDKYPLAGYSPDGLVGEEGLVECKAFQEKKHLKIGTAITPQILSQIQFGLFVSERKWCDLILYDPDIQDISKALITKRFFPLPAVQSTLENIFSNPNTITEQTIAQEIETEAFTNEIMSCVDNDIILNQQTTIFQLLSLVKQMKAIEAKIKQVATDYANQSPHNFKITQEVGEDSFLISATKVSPDVAVKDIQEVETDFLIPLDDDSITVIDGELYQRLDENTDFIIRDDKLYYSTPNLDIVRTLLKMGEELPKGFTVKERKPRIHLEINGETV